VNILGRATTIGGRIVQTSRTRFRWMFSELLPKTIENASVYWKALPLRPGKYRLDVVVKGCEWRPDRELEPWVGCAGVQRREAGHFLP